MIKLVQALMCLNDGLQRESFLAERRLCGVNAPWTFQGDKAASQIAQVKLTSSPAAVIEYY